MCNIHNCKRLKADLAREKLKFAGDTLAEIQEQAKARANELALTGNGSQDYLRAGFVLLASLVGAALLQVLTP